MKKGVLILSKYKNFTRKLPVKQTVALQRMNEIVEDKEVALCDNSQTARLWMQDIEYDKTSRNFVCFARLWSLALDWSLYLYSASKMINLSASTGHHNYPKSTRSYLQKMSDLWFVWKAPVEKFPKKNNLPIKEAIIIGSITGLIWL